MTDRIETVQTCMRDRGADGERKRRKISDIIGLRWHACVEKKM